jgi:molybdopterin molybdotransferase
MISIEEALRLVLTNLPPLRTEAVSVRQAVGRVIAEAVKADGDVPPFRRSAVDGFALRAADVAETPVRLRVVGESRAGSSYAHAVEPGTAVAIMTGAPVPEGADAVQLVELTDRPGPDEVVVRQGVKSGSHIAPAGSEARRGETVLEPGRVIGPAEAAVLATFGRSPVEVYRPPRVALIATGDELVELEETPRRDQIRNSNATSVAGQLQLLGVPAEYLGIARDDPGDLKERIVEGLARDVVILTGGVSVGEYDFVKAVFDELGLEILFTRVAMKPGKPTVFARQGEKLVFGLPGNPVSTFVAFENFVRPALGRLCGLSSPDLPRVRGTSGAEIRHVPGRTAFLPAWAARRETGWVIEPLDWRGSGDIIGFARANATVIVPADRAFIAQGDEVEAMLLADFAWRTRPKP